MAGPYPVKVRGQSVGEGGGGEERRGSKDSKNGSKDGTWWDNMLDRR
jgi:hypothetical protein